MPDEIQPAEGQGQSEPGIFDSYLASVPEDGREAVAAYLKDAEKEVNSRFQSASELQSQYEPFTQIEGLTNYDAETLGNLIAWHGTVQGEGGLEKWVREAAGELGLSFAEAQELQEQTETGQIDQAAIQKLVAEATAPLAEQIQSFTQKEQQAQIVSEIGSQFEQIESTNNVTLSEQEKSMVLDLASTEGFVADPNWIGKAYERFQQIRGLGAEALVSDATQQPPPSITSGGTAAVEPVTDFETAGAQAREMIRRNRG